MNRFRGLILALALCGTMLASRADQAASLANPKATAATAPATPGVELAQSLSTITGVAISPLLGVTAVGMWKYYSTPKEKRSQLPWFAQPLFWVPALSLLAVCFLKDSLGTALPAALKKPFDLIELFENKLSALVAAATFVPLVASVFRANSGGDGAMLGWAGLAMIDLSPFYNVIAVGIAIFAFFIVWMAAQSSASRSALAAAFPATNRAGSSCATAPGWSCLPRHLRSPRASTRSAATGSCRSSAT